MRRYLLGAAMLMSACAGDHEAAELMVREEIRGDTAVVISAGDPPLFMASAVEVTWQSHELGNPQSMARAGEHLVVGDGYRVHVLDSEGAHEHSFGTRGEGPGELQSSSSVGGFGEDTIAVFDARLHRVSLYSPDGRFFDSRRATPELPFVNPSRAGPPLVRHGPGVLWMATENIRPGEPTRAAVIWHDLDADSTTVLEVWDDLVFEELTGGVFGPRDLFPPRAILAVGNDGRIAEGDGIDYCLRIRRIGDPEREMWCRETPRIPVGAGIRSPDLELLAGEPQAELVESMVGEQDPGEFLPHFDRIRFSESGEVWVRTYDEDLADIHPAIAGRRPDLAPQHRQWDVFDSDGALVKRVSLPYSFDPRVMFDDRTFGFWPLETGEITIGRAELEEVRTDSPTAGNGA